MSTFRFKNGNLISGAVLAGLGCYIVAQSRQWEYTGSDGPGPGFFPLWYGLLMIALSIVLMVNELRSPSLAAKRKSWSETGHALAAWAGMAVCVALFKPLGFMIAFTLLTWFIVTVLYRRSIGLGIVVGVLTSAGFYVVFPLALDVQLPVGFLGI